MESTDLTTLTQILGKKGGRHFHSFVYLANELGFRTGHSFTYHYYGVHSFTLDDEDCPDHQPEETPELDLTDKRIQAAILLASQSFLVVDILAVIVYVRWLGISGEGLERKVAEIRHWVKDTPEYFRAWELYWELFGDKERAD